MTAQVGRQENTQVNVLRVPISQIWLDYDLYPRQKPLASRVDDLQSVLESRGKFKDPLVVAQIKGRKGYGLVDGAHRREVFLRKGIKTVDVENLGMLTKQQFMKEAVERNNTGPMQLSPTDRRLAAFKMRKLGMKKRSTRFRSIRNICHTSRDWVLCCLAA